VVRQICPAACGDCSSDGGQAKVALSAVKGERTLAELAQPYEVHATRITQWRTQLLESAADIFGAEARPAEPEIGVKTLHAKIGELTLTNDFLSGALSPIFQKMGRTVAERKAMIDRTQALWASRQARAPGISRGSIHYLPRPASAADLAVMRRIDALHMARTLGCVDIQPVAGCVLLREKIAISMACPVEGRGKRGLARQCLG
jgi:hypothetical protein